MRISDLKNLFTRVFAGYTILANGKRLYLLSAAISAGTETAAPAGSIGVTSHATGAGQLFISDGSAWQVLSGRDAQHLGLATVATSAGNTDVYATVPFASRLVAAVFTGIDALATSDTNYVTFSLTNLGINGGGSTAMLAATDANTTKATGGTALAANTPRSLTLNGTAANLVVAALSRLRFRVAATGTLGNTITGPTCLLIFERNV